MGQQETSDFLKMNRNKWFTSKQMAKNLKVSVGSVINSLAKLRKSKQVRYKSTGKANQYAYKHKTS